MVKAGTGSETGQLLGDFQQLLAQRQMQLSRFTTKEEGIAKEKDNETVALASSFTIENIIRGLADLQLTLNHEIDRLADILIVESSKLTQVRRALEIETRHLEELTQIDTVAKVLDLLVQEKQAEADAFEKQAAQEKESIEQEITQQREAWQAEEQEQERAVAAYEQDLLKERSQAEADFGYNLDRKRRIEADEFETAKRRKEQEIAETEREKQIQWAERKRMVAARQQTLDAYRAQIEPFPRELESAVQQARDNAFQAASEEAQFRTELLRKESTANQQVRELEIQALEATIARQASQIEALSSELQGAIKQAQALAAQAIRGSAGTESLSATQVDK